MVGGKRKRFSASYHLVASPGAEGFATVAEVPAGKVLRLQKFEVQFPTGTSDELEVALYYGNIKVYPNEGVLVGDNVRYEKDVEATYFSGDPIKVRYKNLNATYERVCDIVVEGVLE